MKRIFLIIVFFLSHRIVYADRPFWTEKASYIDGDKIYFVGISMDAKTLEGGRENTIGSARTELAAYINSTKKAWGMPLRTQMIYQERSKKGWNVYRLIYIEIKDLKDAENDEEWPPKSVDEKGRVRHCVYY